MAQPPGLPIGLLVGDSSPIFILLVIFLLVRSRSLRISSGVRGGVQGDTPVAAQDRLEVNKGTTAAPHLLLPF